MATTSPNGISYPTNSDAQKTIEQRFQDTAESVQEAFNSLPISNNYIINGAMDIWQRATTSGLSNWSYNSVDRFFVGVNNGGGNVYKETSDVPSSAFGASLKIVVGGFGYPLVGQTIEQLNAKSLAGKTVTASVYVKSNQSINMTVNLGYSTAGDTAYNGSWTALSPDTKPVAADTWTRIYQTYEVPSTATSLRFYIGTESGVSSGGTLYYTGFQLEEGSSATPFRRNQPNIQAELAACQRYYWRYTETINYRFLSSALCWGGNEAVVAIKFPVTMRANPSTSISNLSGVYWLGNGTNYTSASNFNQYNTVETWGMYCTLTAPQNTALMFRMPINSYIEANAEL